MHRLRSIAVMVLLVVTLAWGVTACGGGGGQTGTTVPAGPGDTTVSTIPPAKNPVRIVFNAEMTGPLVYDAALVRKGVRTALEMLKYQLEKWPIEYKEFDNKSDPLVAVEQIRAVVDINRDNNPKTTEPVDFICGPLSSSAVAGVTFFLEQRIKRNERIPQCSVTAQPSENIITSGGQGFIPNGIYSSHGYYLGKFAAENMGYKTANCIHYTDRIAEELQAGFERGFTEAGGLITSLVYVPSGTIDFTSYLAAMLPADCTMFWVRGNGAIPFVRQYAASGLTGQLLVPQSSNYSESQLKYLQGLGVGLDMIACDVYTPMIQTPKNLEFIAAYQKLYPGEYPTPEAFGGWQAIMLYAEGVKSVAAQRNREDQANQVAEDKRVDPRDPADVIAAMAKVTMDTPAGSITMSKLGKTWVSTRNFYILRSNDVGGGRVGWTPIRTYSQVRMGQ